MDLWTADGRHHSVATEAARGSSSNPMKDTEIEDKLRAEAGRWRPGHDIQPLIDAVWTLDKSGDVSTTVTDDPSTNCNATFNVTLKMP